MTVLSEITELARASTRHGSVAYALLTCLREDYGDHCARGGAFSITPKTLERENYIPRWTRRQYEKARDILLITGHLQRVGYAQSLKGRPPALYRLTTKGIYSAEERNSYCPDIRAGGELCVH